MYKALKNMSMNINQTPGEQMHGITQSCIGQPKKNKYGIEELPFYKKAIRAVRNTCREMNIEVRRGDLSVSERMHEKILNEYLKRVGDDANVLKNPSGWVNFYYGNAGAKGWFNKHYKLTRQALFFGERSDKVLSDLSQKWIRAQHKKFMAICDENGWHLK